MGENLLGADVGGGETKLVVNTTANLLSLVFIGEQADHYKVVEPDIVFLYNDAGNVMEIDIPNLSSHLAGKKVPALELALAPDHSDTVFEIALPKPVQALVEEAKRRSAARQR